MKPVKLSMSLARSRLAIAFFFAVAGLAFSSWAVRTPYLQEKLQLAKLDWGFLLLCPVASSFTATLLANVLIGRFSSRNITLVGAGLVLLAIVFIGLAPSIVLLAGAFLVFGAGLGLLDIAMNDQAVALEQYYGRSIMSSFHGIFSVGAMLGALLGGLAAKLAIIPAYHLAGVACLLALGCWLCSSALLSANQVISDEIKEDMEVPLIVLPSGKLWIVGAIAAAAVFIEGAMTDWSALFLKNMQATEGMAALGLAAFTGVMAVGRLVGDKWIDLVGRISAIWIGGICATLGLLMALVSKLVVVAIMGFTIAGLGVSILFPCLLSLAVKTKEANTTSSAAIAAVAMMGYVSMLVGPPMIGFLAHLIGLQLAFVALLIAALAIMCLVGFIKNKEI